MADYTQIQREAVLGAKNRIACIANKAYNAGKYGDKTPSECCITDVLFTYGLMRDVECYVIDGENNCWDEDQFLEAIGILNNLLI
jgi:hypothetical protein